MDKSLTQEQLERLLDHADWLRALARRLVQDASAADDLVQETWLAALSSPPDTTLPVRPWLAGVARKLALLKRRGDGRRARRNAIAARPEGLPSAADLVAEVDLKHSLSQLVLALAEPVRTTVLLRYHEGLSSAEIARRQGVPAGTVRWRLKRGLDQLRIEMDERFGTRESWLGALAMFARVPQATGVSLAGLGGASGALGVVAALGLLALFAVARGACQATAPREAPLAVSAGSSPSEALAPLAGTPDPAVRSDAVPATVADATERTERRTLRIVDARAEPVRGARVVLSLGNGALIDAATDDEGVLTDPGITAASSAPIETFVQRPGAFLVRAELTLNEAGETLLRLPAGEAFQGRVEAQGEGPAAALLLELDSDLQLWGGRAIPPAVAALVGNGRRARVVTDADGRFEFHGLTSDWSGVLWLPPSHRFVGARTGVDRDESLYVDGPAVGALLLVARRARLTGRVVDDDGSALEGAELRGYLSGLAAPLDARSGRDGRFAFALPDGTATARELVVEVSADAAGPTRTRRYASLPPDGDLGELTADRPASSAPAPSHRRDVRLSVVQTGGAPQASVYLRLVAEGALFADPAPAPGAARPLHSTARDAFFLLPPSGELLVTGLSPDAGLVAIAEDASGRALVTRSLPTYAPGDDLEALRLRVDAPLRALEVAAFDESGELLVGGVVQLGQDGRRGVYRRMGLDGRTRFEGLAASTERVDIEVVKRGFVPLRHIGAAVPRQGEALTLILQRSVDVTIDVDDATGAAVDDATLTVALDGGLVRTGRRIAPGRYRIEDVPRSRLELRLRRPGTERLAPIDATVEDTFTLRLSAQ